MQSSFRPAWWARNRHIQTIWGNLFYKNNLPSQLGRIRLELKDGDFLDFDWFDGHTDYCVVLLHGLEGSIESHYIQGMMRTFQKLGVKVGVLHFRGCSGEQNRLLRSYHSGVSDDLNEALNLLFELGFDVRHLIGYSLGGNVLLKWLGEFSNNTRVKSAVAVSVPLLLNECADAIDKGFSKIYSRHLLKTLKQKTLYKKSQFDGQMSLDYGEVEGINNFWEFDEKVTAKLNGFNSAEDYYHQVSSRQFLSMIRTPTLVIHAKDDPFMNEKVIPAENELSSSIQFELSDKGGHVGFIEGKWPWRPSYYLERRIPEFLLKFS
ncbi:MAG: hydrolase [Kangiellaceae bacterium]|nr:hydrolase [Kangiellaceae bacterium]MCW8997140.1 hydrolase [Kangiellaceae bacterium]